MNPVTQGTILPVAGTVIASGGTCAPTAIDFGPVYDPNARFALYVAASSAGSIVATIQAGTAAASGLTTIGTINAGVTTGLHTLDLGGAIINRYLKTTITSTGGTGIVAASVAAQARTITA
jgi:hypothetical protein